MFEIFHRIKLIIQNNVKLGLLCCWAFFRVFLLIKIIDKHFFIQGGDLSDITLYGQFWDDTEPQFLIGSTRSVNNISLPAWIGNFIENVISLHPTVGVSMLALVTPQFSYF